MRLKIFLSALTASLLISGCGGSGGGTEPTPPTSNTPTPTSSKAVHGPITGFGSVIVAGTRFDSSNASITVDGLPDAEESLQEGQIVTIHGSIDANGRAKADRIDFDAEIRGLITQIDIDNSLIVALGQVILITDATSFDDGIEPAAIESLNVGDVVVVSGFSDSTGNIVASHIERKNSTDKFKVKGTVSNVDPAGMVFNIEALIIDYSGATLEHFTDGIINDGDYVKAKCDGSTASCFTPDGVLLATKVELKDDDMGDDADEVELEGVISRFESVTDFDVAGRAVTTTNATRFDGGTADDLILDLRVKVEGSLDAAGVLVADKIRIKREERIRVIATADAVDTVAQSLTVLGIELLMSEDTRFKDKSRAKLRMFGLSDIAVGDRLHVRGYQAIPGMGPIMATRVERRRADDDDDVELRGYVESFDPVLQTLVVHGVSIESDADTDFSDSFFDLVTPGSLVKIRGTRLGDAVLAQKVQLKSGDMDDDDEQKIKGFVTRFESAEDFDVAGRPVTSDEMTQFEHGTAADLALDVHVEVKGHRNADGIVIARRIKFSDDDEDDEDDDDSDDSDSDDVEFKGLISGFVSPEEFNVADHPVTTTAETRFEDGTADDLADGVKVEVEGMLNADGVLVAQEVEFEEHGDIRVAGTIQSLDSSSITVLGITITMSDRTYLATGDNALAAGDWVSIRGRQSRDGSIVASSVRRHTIDDATAVLLRAGADEVNVADGSLTILGISILTTADTVFNGHNHMPMTADAFFARARAGSVIDVKGHADDTNVVTAARITLQRM